MQTEENDLQIFPNPTHSTIQLVANGKKLNKGVAEIINVHGLVVKRVEIVASANQELNVSDVPVGIYQLVYTTDSGTLSRKVVVARWSFAGPYQMAFCIQFRAVNTNTPKKMAMLRLNPIGARKLPTDGQTNIKIVTKP